MAIIQATLWDAAPGRTAEVIGHMAHAKKIHQRLGATVRTLQVQVGGTGSQRLVYSLKYDNMTAYGKAQTALAADAEWGTFLTMVLGSPSPAATLFSNGLSRELPGFEGPYPVTGKSVSVLTQIRANPGRMEDLLKDIGGIKGNLEKSGGSVSVRQAFLSGENTNTIALALTYDDLEAFGKGIDALVADSDYMAAQARFAAANSSGVLVSRSQAIELPT